MAIQTKYSINPEPAKPNKVMLSIDVTNLEKERIDALVSEIEAYASGLKDNFDIGNHQVSAV